MSNTPIAAQGQPVEFYWAGVHSEEVTQHIHAAVEALLQATNGATNRLTNPHTRAYARAAFKNRIERLRRGKLRPPAEVKPVNPLGVKLYEVRWSDVNAHALTETKERKPVKLHIRMIFAEPVQLGYAALGLHAHEKEILPSKRETKEAQDEHIAHAARLYVDGEPSAWGVIPRA